MKPLKRGQLLYLVWRRYLGGKAYKKRKWPGNAIVRKAELFQEAHGWQGKELLNVPVSEDQLRQWRFSHDDDLFLFNLNYLSLLGNDDFTHELKSEVIRIFYRDILENEKARHPYTASQRVFNLLAFVHSYGAIPGWEDDLYSDLFFIRDNIEFDIDGNHLLENLMALYVGSQVLGWQSGVNKACRYVFKELDAQILPDGGHYELSPMYHNLILEHVIFCLMISKLYGAPVSDTKYFETKTDLMLNWSRHMKMTKKAFPFFQDSTGNVACDYETLRSITSSSGVRMNETRQPENIDTYAVLDGGDYRLWIDTGLLGPAHQPGHSRAQALTFEMEVNGQPFIVNNGISTYHDPSLRLKERQSSYFNTVMIDGLNSSDVWSKFRMGRRARSLRRAIYDKIVDLKLQHYGGAVHKRKFQVQEKELIITDRVEKDKRSMNRAYFHFDPEIKIEQVGDSLVTDKGELLFQGADQIWCEGYEYACEFNKRRPASRVVATFRDRLITSVRIHVSKA